MGGRSNEGTDGLLVETEKRKEWNIGKNKIFLKVEKIDIHILGLGLSIYKIISNLVVKVQIIGEKKHSYFTKYQI